MQNDVLCNPRAYTNGYFVYASYMYRKMGAYQNVTPGSSFYIRFCRLLNTLQLPISMEENLVNWQLWFLWLRIMLMTNHILGPLGRNQSHGVCLLVYFNKIAFNSIMSNAPLFRLRVCMLYLESIHSGFSSWTLNWQYCVNLGYET